MDPVMAAERWARTWEAAWPIRDASAVAACYAPEATYRSHPHRDPEAGGALAYATRTFAEEHDIECRFGSPIVTGDRAAVEWWASFIEDGREITLTGATVLRFGADGLVVDHVDYWVSSDGRRPPPAGWGR